MLVRALMSRSVISCTTMGHGASRSPPDEATWAILVVANSSDRICLPRLAVRAGQRCDLRVMTQLLPQVAA